MNRDKFLSVYRDKLKEAMVNYPSEYMFGPDHFDMVYLKMEKAIAKGTFNKDGRAFKATCKELGIKHTYKAISEYFGDVK
jgi:hypothetical protein